MMLAAGVKENILFWDLRKTSPGKQQQADAIFSESHNEELTHVPPSPRSFGLVMLPNLTQHAGLSRTQILFHPVAQNRLFSSSTDGLVCMFDTTQSNEDDALISGALFFSTPQ